MPKLTFLSLGLFSEDFGWSNSTAFYHLPSHTLSLPLQSSLEIHMILPVRGRAIIFLHLGAKPILPLVSCLGVLKLILVAQTGILDFTVHRM